MILSKKNIIIIFSLLVISISAQHKGRHNNESFPRSVGIETHIVPSNTLFNCFICFKIGFKNLVFIREKGNYQSGISFTVEISDGDKIVERVIKSSSTLVDDYDLTKSKSLFLEDIVAAKLPEGEYVFNPVISIENTDIELKLKPLNVTVNSKNLSYPIPIYEGKVNSKDKKLYRLYNSENSIPYSLEEYDLLIPVFNQSINSIDVEIIQNGKTVISNSFNEFENIKMKIEAFDGKIIIDSDEKNSIAKLFRIPNVNKKLKEGVANIKVSLGDDIEDYSIKVLWNDKPNSLLDAESAVKMLKIIGKKVQADSLLDYDEEQYSQVLTEYWDQYDNDTTTAFNEVYAEYYTRIDQANEDFRQLNGTPGSLTDRGIIYVKYGEPDSIKREYNENYDTIEVWEYRSFGKKIYFSDITGTGDFKRIK